MCLIKAWPVTSPLSRGLLQHSCTAKTAPSSADCWLPIKQWKGLGIHTHLSWQRPNLQPACHRVSVSGLIYTCHGWSLQSAETADGQVVPTPPQPAPLLSLSLAPFLCWSRTLLSAWAQRGAIHQGRWVIETLCDNGHQRRKQQPINIRWHALRSRRWWSGGGKTRNWDRERDSMKDYGGRDGEMI